MDNTLSNISVKELSDVREYFSHNIRTSTAMVVATVMVLKYGLSEEDSTGTDIISESAYFLDVYDKGMDICFDFVLGKPVKNDGEEISPSKIIRHFAAKLPITIKEQGIDFSEDLDEFVCKSNGYMVKTLLEMILCQEVRAAKGKLSVTGKNGEYRLINSEPIGKPPEIYKIFKKIFADLGTDFSFGDNFLTLRFAK